MTPQDFANAFSHDWSENYADYRDEAESRWGESEEWAASQSKVRSMSASDWQNAQASDAAFVSELHSAWQAGVRPGSAAADRIVALHREQIDQWYESSLSKQLILAQMYVSDDRFAAHYQALRLIFWSLSATLPSAEVWTWIIRRGFSLPTPWASAQLACGKYERGSTE
nr:TipAS antibiotic-recognition domain-containing protein [Corynebacterium pseudotuberculosis]